MGWWTEDHLGQEVMQGDTPYDIMMDAFEKIVSAYQNNFERKPTLSEIVRMTEVILTVGADNYFQNGDSLEITKLTMKTKERKKYQKCQVGDFFIVPFKRDIYAFGRVLSDLKVNHLGMLIGIYNKFSKRILSPLQLKNDVFMFTPFYCSNEGWKNGKWRIIGNIPIISGDFIYPKHKEGIEGLGWWIIEGNEQREATQQEVEDMEYAQLWSAKAVEERIIAHLEGND